MHKKLRVKLFAPARHTMQAGLLKTRYWVLEFEPSTPLSIDPLMNWPSSSVPESQLRLKFSSKEAALKYAKSHNWDVEVQPTQKSDFKIKSYAANFAPNRLT